MVEPDRASAALVLWAANLRQALLNLPSRLAPQMAAKERDGAKKLIADAVEEMVRFDNGG